MAIEDPLLKYLKKLRVHRCGDAGRAGLWIASVPLPKNAPLPFSLAGQAAYAEPLGRWPGTDSPRRLLIVAQGNGEAPDSVPLTEKSAAPESAAPAAQMRLIESAPDFFFFWESHALEITWGGRTVELALGLRTRGAIHWWEACRLVVRKESESCRVIEMGGAIAVVRVGMKELKHWPGSTNPFLHKHNWLNGQIYARLHANGVCEVFARHVNSRFFDDGLPLKDAVPVVGIRVKDAPEAAGGPFDHAQGRPEGTRMGGAWDGTQTSLRCGEVEFDLSDAAHLASRAQPGSLAREGDFLVWQPYEGVELYGGGPTQEITGDPYICRARDRAIPRGMARTLRFSLSLSPERSPRVVRYLPPAWWYGACEEFLPAPILPVSNEYDRTLESARNWIRAGQNRGGFEDGSVPRGGSREGGWEGETPYAQFLDAWRTGQFRDYDDAMRSAWYFTDVAVDHAAKMVRMHAYPPNAFAVPMARVQACVAAWLETGDPFPLDTARAVTETAYWCHKNSWPRLAVGRDACFTRGAVLLYRYLAEDRYRVIARDGLADALAAQSPDGSFGDQGGGSGIHQWAAYIVKPWMGLMALGGALDYLELFPEDPELLEGVRRFGEWLLRERHDHDGVMGWSYQHLYRGGRTFFDPFSGKEQSLPTQPLWHEEYLARFLMFCALRFERPEYFEAWEEGHRGKEDRMAGDHSCSTALQFVPWLQAKLWQASVTADGLSAQPAWFGKCTPAAGTVQGPEGPIALRWSADGRPSAPADSGVALKPRTVLAH